MMTSTTGFLPTYPTMPHISEFLLANVSVRGDADFLKAEITLITNRRGLLVEGETKLLNYRVS